MTTPFACRSCGSQRIHEVLSLGETPLANSLLTEAQLAAVKSGAFVEPRYPLELVFCADCTLLQINATVAAETLFGEYLYFSSFSDTMLAHAKVLCERLRQERHLTSSSLVVEVASNDGYLLKNYVAAGIPTLGIEPAHNIAKVANEHGVPTLCEFFGAELAQRLRDDGKRADILHANNVLAHVPDLNGFVAGIRTLLKDDGIAVLEFPQAKEMLRHCEFDTIYHEHLCYYSLTALCSLFARHGLSVVDAEELPIHGGSLRIFAAHEGAAAPSPAVQRLLDEEKSLGLRGIDGYRAFATRAVELQHDLRKLLGELKASGKRIVAYGAAAKGSTLLNSLALPEGTLDFVVDRSTYKQGQSMPGVHLPIRAPAALLEVMPDYVLLLTWNFATEILAQQADYRQRGGKFILPLPQVQIL